MCGLNFESGLSFSPDTCMTEERSPLYVMKNFHESHHKGDADAWEVSPRRLKLLKKVGEGNFGIVYLAKLDMKSHVAVKKLKTQASSDEVNDFLGEIRMLKLVGRHPFVVSLVGCCTLEQPYYALLEYAPGGSLHQKLVLLRESWKIRMRTISKACSEASSYCQHPGEDSLRMRTSVAETEYTTLSDGEASCGDAQRGNSISINLPRLGGGNTVSSIGSDVFTDSDDFTISDFKMSPLKQQETIPVFSRNSSIEQVLDSRTLHRYALQIAKGMEHLESKEIVHRDLAARNVLIDDRGNLKVSDLGLSRQGIYVPTKQNALPLRWLAPEAISGLHFSNKSDVWAFAVVLWEIGTLAGFPYQSINNEGIKHFLSSGGRLEKPEIVSPCLYEVMLQCWEENPDRRPSFTELVNYLEGDENRNKVYVSLNTISRNYVFPPTEQMNSLTERRLKDMLNNNKIV